MVIPSVGGLWRSSCKRGCAWSRFGSCPRHSSLDALARYLPAGKLKLARQTASTSMVLDRGLSRGSLFALPSLGSS